MAERTGLEPATSDVTGRRSNQLNYHPSEEVAARCDLAVTSDQGANTKHITQWWAVQDSNL